MCLWCYGNAYSSVHCVFLQIKMSLAKNSVPSSQDGWANEWWTPYENTVRQRVCWFFRFHYPFQERIYPSTIDDKQTIEYDWREIEWVSTMMHHWASPLKAQVSFSWTLQLKWKGSHIQCYVTPCREASCASHKGDARDTKHQTISKTIWSDWEVSLLKIVRDWCNTLLTVKNYSHSHTYRVLILHLIFCIHVFS